MVDLITQVKLQEGDIKLRALAIHDAEMLYVLSDKNRYHLRKWLGWVDRLKQVEDSRMFIQSSIDKASKGIGGDFGIFYQDKLVGVIGLPEMDNLNKKLTIGYWLDAEIQGKGVMTKAVKLIIDYTFSVLKFNRVKITCATGNDKSCAIPKRLGFIFEGVERDAEWLYDHFVDWNVFSMLKNEWKSASFK